MTKFKKYLAVFAATVLLVSAFAPGLILSAESVGSADNDVLFYTNTSEWARTAWATAWSDEEAYWAWARVEHYGRLIDSAYDSDLPYSLGGTGYSAVANAIGTKDGNPNVAAVDDGYQDYGFGGIPSSAPASD